MNSRRCASRVTPASSLAGDRSFPEPSHTVRLLPEYDAYVMGFREREELVPQPVRDLIASHGRGRYEGPAAVRLVLVDGIAAGLWERRKRGKTSRARCSACKPGQEVGSGGAPA